MVPIGGLPGGIPIASLIGDSHASLYGLGGFRPGSVKATYGTGSSLMTPTSQPIISRQGLSTTVAWGGDLTRGKRRCEERPLRRSNLIHFWRLLRPKQRASQ